MAHTRAISVKCPNCAAFLRADAEKPVVTCEYCGVTARLQARTRVLERKKPLPPGPQEMPVAVESRSRIWLAKILGAPISLAGIATFWLLHGGANLAVRETVRAVAKELQDTAALATHFGSTWQGTGNMFLVDVNGDGTLDPIGRTRHVGAGDEVTISAFDGERGDRLWESEPIGSYSDTLSHPVVLRADQILAADAGGGVRAIALTDGRTLWRQVLGEQVVAFCEGGDRVVARLSDATWRALDPRTGESTTVAARKSCTPLPSDKDNPNAFVERDMYRRRGRLPRVKGMHVMSAIGDVAIGVKSPGTPIPLLARVVGEKVAWIVELPGQDRLSASGAPLLAVGTPDAVVALYERKSPRSYRLVRIDLAQGLRVWEVELPDTGSIEVFEGIAASGRHVFISAWGHLDAFDLATGKHVYRIGRR